MEVPFPVVHSGHKVEVTKVLRVAPDVAYKFWRNLRNHPYFTEHLESVEVLNDRQSRWVWDVKPFGLTTAWISEIIADVPDKMLSWQTLPGSTIQQAGSIWFRPHPEGTEVHWLNAWDPPAGEIGALAAKILGEDPAQTMEESLERLRSLLEAWQTPKNRNGNETETLV